MKKRKGIAPIMRLGQKFKAEHPTLRKGQESTRVHPILRSSPDDMPPAVKKALKAIMGTGVLQDRSKKKKSPLGAQ